MKKTILILLWSIFLGACTSFKKEKVAELPADPQVLSYLDQQLNEAELLLEQGNNQEAEEKFREYESKWNFTVYILRAKIGLARALTEQGRPSLAIPILNEVIETSAQRYPEVTALASFSLSFAYDSLGEDAKTQVALKDAEKMSNYLKPQLALAEIPARLAAFYNRKGEEVLAREYYRKAEQGMNQISPSEKAKVYFLMGRLSTAQVDADNFEKLAGMLSVTQIFLLRSSEINHKNWSAAATKELIQNYSDLWNSILSFPRQQVNDVVLSRAEHNEKRIHAINAILKNIEILKPYYNSARENENTRKTFAFLNELTRNGQEVILAASAQSPITEEALRHQSLKRDIKVKSDKVADPNL